MTDRTASKPPRPSAKTASTNQAPPQTLAQRAQGAANDAGERLHDSVDANPLAVLAGGIAVGLAAGALLPKTQVEQQYLGPIGAKLNEGARTAAAAATEAGKAELAAAGLSRVGANEGIGKLVEGLGAALRSAGTAARDSRGNRGGRDEG